MSDRNFVGLVHNPLVPEAATLCESLVDSLMLRDNYWLVSAGELDVSPEMLARTSAIIAAGGDGTILRVVRIAAPHSVPIIGVNMGRVGFMSELSVDEAETELPSYLLGGRRVEERMMLQASVLSVSPDRPRLTVHALNDVVVARGAVARLMDVNTKIDGVLLTTYRADGIIVATPTGSTGYALSAGGPILYPEAREMLVQPLAAHMSFQTGIVISKDSVIELSVEDESEAVLSVDGFNNATLGPGDRVVVEKSPYLTRFLRRGPPAEFYSTLTRRLGVSGRQVPPAVKG